MRKPAPAKNRGFDFRGRVRGVAGPTSLLDYLAHAFDHTGRDEWRERIARGRVLLDGSPADVSAQVRDGQQVVWSRPPWTEPDAPAEFAVLHEDPDLLVVAKPAGLPTLPGAGFLERTLLSRVRSYDPQSSPIHRLGRWTSGLVVFARTPRARSALCRELRDRRVEKRYLALAAGRAASERFDIVNSIGPVPHALLGSLHAATPTGRSSLSRVRVVEQRDAEFLAEVEPVTGRPHQIRIHLAAAGHPLVGDPLYAAGGVPRRDTTALPGDPGYRLHAVEIRLLHPATGATLVVRCAPPASLRETSR
ncbi:MAG: RluA family pseudouridine synthase [bacterium]|nr:RluA family pseudouridine synthase [bacterium]